MRKRLIKKKFKKDKKVDEKKFEEVAKNLHPMALGIMVSETNKIGNSPKTSFEDYIVKSTKALLDKNIKSEKWIHSINSFVEKRIKEMSAEDPEHQEGEKLNLERLTIISSSVKQSNYGTYYSVLSINESGWKYHFSTSKMPVVSAGDKFSLSGTVKKNGEGITFLSRIKIISYTKKENNEITFL